MNLKVAMIGQKGLPATYGGVEHHVEEISTRLAKKGIEVTVFCRPHYSEKEIQNKKLLKIADSKYFYNGIILEMLPSIPTKHLDAASHTLISTLVSIFRNYNIIHYHALGPTFFSPIAKIFKKKVVTTIHGLDYMRDKWGITAKKMLKTGEWISAYYPNRIIVVSKQLQDYYKSQYNKNTCYIPNGINIPPKTSPDLLKLKFNLLPNDYFLFVGRLVPEKGCHTLIKAFKNIQTDKKLVIVGGSSHSDDYILSLKKEADNDKRIVFVGYIYGELLDTLYEHSYAFIFPSEMEGLPIVLLEAIAHGCTVIASDIPENLEIFSSIQREIPIVNFFKNKDINSLYETISKILNKKNSNSRSTPKNQEIELILKDYNWDTITDKTLEVYLSLMKKN